MTIMIMALSTQIVKAGLCAVDTSILPENTCIMGLLLLALKILVYGLGAVAVIGILIAGIMYMTARDNEGQVTAAKKRLFNVVIGMAAWAMMWGILSWIIPGGMSIDMNATYDVVCKAEQTAIKDSDENVANSQRPGEISEGTRPSSGGTSTTTHFKNPYASEIYTNNRNGLTFQLYEQCNDQWGKLNNGGVCSYGCNMIAAASALSGIDSSITPETLYKAGGQHDVLDVYATKIPSASGKFSCGKAEASWSAIKEKLSQGAVVVMLAKSSVRSQHYIALLDINSTKDKVFIGNSYKPETSVSKIFFTGWQNISDITKTHPIVGDVRYCVKK